MKTSKPCIILASNSPRRSDLLKQINVAFHVAPARVREQIQKNECPEDYVLRIAEKKSEKVALEYPACTVIGADTIVVLHHQILGKPKSRKMAKGMLGDLQGKEHTVITAVSLINRSKSIRLSRLEKTKVRMKRLSDKEIDDYVRTKEPMDKAGAYGIQEIGAVLIEGIQGSYTNVVGLPLETLWDMFKEAGIQP